MKTTTTNNRPARRGTTASNASSLRPALIPDSDTTKTTRFPGVHFDSTGPWRSSIPAALVPQLMGRKDAGIRTAVVIVEAAHVVVDVIVKRRDAEFFEHLYQTMARPLLSDRVHEELSPDIRRVTELPVIEDPHAARVLFASRFSKIDCFADMTGSKRARLALSFQSRHWLEVLNLADQLRVPVEKLLRSVICEHAGNVRYAMAQREKRLSRSSRS